MLTSKKLDFLSSRRSLEGYTAFARFAMLHVAPNWLSAFSPAETATNFDALFVRPGCTPRLRAFFVLCECVSPALLGSAGDTGELAVGAGRTVGSAGNTGRRQRALKRSDAVVAMGALRDVRALGQQQSRLADPFRSEWPGAHYTDSERASAELHGKLLCSVFAFLAASDEVFVVTAVCRRWRVWGCSPGLWQLVLRGTMDCMGQLFARAVAPQQSPAPLFSPQAPGF